MRATTNKKSTIVIVLYAVSVSSALAITPMVADPSVAKDVDAPVEVRDALLQTYFLGAGTFEKHELDREVWGGSHRVVFRIDEAVVYEGTNTSISFFCVLR